MNILDENIPRSQRLLLLSWGVHVKQIGLDIGHKGLLDEEIISLLHSLRQPTFITRDEDFYDRRLAHAGYSLVYLAVDKYESAFFARRALRHRELRTKAQRIGAVIRVSGAGIWLWRLLAKKEEFLSWT
ncbi:MAG: hypothetical protein J2P21_14495 [Chloracidobacterium sp.]|nr:hypothetical protein [Chloracidobacterium sp.]